MGSIPFADPPGPKGHVNIAITLSPSWSLKTFHKSSPLTLLDQLKLNLICTFLRVFCLDLTLITKKNCIKKKKTIILRHFKSMRSTFPTFKENRTTRSFPLLCNSYHFVLHFSVINLISIAGSFMRLFSNTERTWPFISEEKG